MKKRKYKLNFYTQYNQFYIVDKDGSFDPASSDLWPDDAGSERLGIVEGTVGVYTECYGPVKGELEILKEPSKGGYEGYDHVVEGGIDVVSGALQIQDCLNSSVQLELKMNPGQYRVRVYSSNLASVQGDEGDDYYKIEIWPEEKGITRKVLKQYNP